MLSGDAQRRSWELEGPLLTGFSVYHAIRDPRDGALYAATNFFDGGTVHRSTDDGATWERAGARPPEDGELKLNATWHIEPGSNGELWLGSDPGVLFLRRQGRDVAGEPGAARARDPRPVESGPAGCACTRSTSTPTTPTSS